MKIERLAQPAVVSTVLALVVYAVTLRGTYIWDDTYIARDDPRLASPGQWKHLWTTDYFNGGIDNLYRPLTSMSYAVQKWAVGDRAWAFHLINWLLHAAVCAAVAELARRCAGTTVAWIAGMLFAVHPIHTEAVAQIVGRAELLCALMVFIALLLFLKRPLTVQRAVAVLFAEIIAILCKEQGILLPAMFLAAGVLIWPQQGKLAPQERAALKWFVFLLTWATAGYLIWRESFLRFEWDRHFLDSVRQPLALSKGIDRWLMPVVLLGHYAQLMLLPLKLSPDYSRVTIGFVARMNDPYLWFGFATIALWAISLIVSLRKQAHFTAFCLIAAALVYSVTSNAVILIVMSMGERWAYLPSAFILILFAMLLVKLPRRVCIMVTAALIVLASIRTISYAAQWNDRTSFLRYAHEQNPDSAVLAVLMAEDLRSTGHPDQAEQLMLQTVPRLGDCWVIWNELGLDAAFQHHFDDAERYLDRGFHMNIGVAMTGMYVRDLKTKWMASTQATTRPE